MGRVLDVVYFFAFSGLFLVSLTTLIRSFEKDTRELDVADELHQTWQERTGHK